MGGKGRRESRGRGERGAGMVEGRGGGVYTVAVAGKGMKGWTRGGAG
jgi:hypothetical protein